MTTPTPAKPATPATPEVLRSHPLPMDACTISGLAAGDLVGQGALDVVLRYGHAGSIHLAALAHDGRCLWTHDTGLPVVGGWDGASLHVPYLCWDVDGDGRTEVVLHDAGAARGWHGERYDVGAVTGERLVVLDGATGSIKAECPWPGWKPRVMMTVGHLDGWDRPPSLVLCDDTYKDVVVTVLRGSDLTVRWRRLQGRPAGHNVDCADVDGDGRQEVIVGGVCYRPDGEVLWSAEPFGHTDMSKAAKIRPDLPGLQVWYLVEGHNPGVYLVGADGATLWKEPFGHAHFGWIGKQDPDLPGLQPHAAEDARRADAATRRAGHFPIFTATGAHWCALSDRQRKAYMPVAWRGDGLTDFIDRKTKRVVRLARDGGEAVLAELPAGIRLDRNLLRYAEGDDGRESIITVDERDNRLVALRAPAPSPPGGLTPRASRAYRHDRSQTGSGYYLYCCAHDGWDLG